MTGIVAHTYPEWWLKLAGQVAHWSTDYSFPSVKSRNFIFYELHNYIVLGGSVNSSMGRFATISSPCISM